MNILTYLLSSGIHRFSTDIENCLKTKIQQLSLQKSMLSTRCLYDVKITCTNKQGSEGSYKFESHDV